MDLGQIISDNIHDHLLKVVETKTLYMSSYVIYCVARMGQFSGLIPIVSMDDVLDQKKVWEYYDQLELKASDNHFKRVNDAFLYVITNQLIGDVGFILSREAMEFIEEWGYWFIQYPKSTYFRLFGYDIHPFKFPRCCGDKWVLMEFARQAAKVNAKFSAQHKAGCHSFPM